ncbi:ABC transporter permease [Mesorhizobium sp. M1348]|uniref:ABC transporter permease n=1 Tax=Mesorhizobium sp. M1348 TaxID=2957089 RepID=UPI0033365803
MAVQEALTVPGSPARARSWSQTHILVMFLGPAAAYALIFLILPYASVLRFSVWSVENYAINQELTTANYWRIVENPLYRAAIRNSLLVAVIVTTASVVVGYALAVYIAFFAGRARSALYFLLIIPLWTSFLLRAFIWRMILGRQGILNSALLWVGVVDKPVDVLLFNMFSVCLTLTYVFIPFVALPVYAALEKIPKDLIEASMDLGGSVWITFRRVIIPLSLPGVVTGAIFTFCLSLGDFVAPTLLGGPDVLMVSSVIINQFGAAFDWPMGSALAVIVIVIVATGVALATQLERRNG